jgi:hypothetical protein
VAPNNRIAIVQEKSASNNLELQKKEGDPRKKVETAGGNPKRKW